MPVTYKKIATVTVTTATQAAIEFTSIPGTYTDLVVLASVRNSGSSGVVLRLKFNGSSSNHSDRYIEGDGATVVSGSNGGGGAGHIFSGNVTRSTDTASTFASNYIYIPNYGSSSNKSLSADGVTENNATTAYTNLTAGLWSDASVITAIQLTPSANSFAQYSTATLYGIKKD
jgi:hypothetical protein